MTCTVFANGVFDGGLHAGHINLLIKCRALAGRYGRVIVGLDSDNKIKADKGFHRPYYSEKERESHIMSLTYPIDSLIVKLVNNIYFFDTNEMLYETIKNLKPDFIVKGSDWQGNVIGSDLAEVILVDLEPKISLTKLENKIRK